ncbi:MAG: DnaJ domain-containing protein [Nitrospiraceae bacterium]|nr:DnaJ domain-containing protein [Nitrospiraceae bacterium]
MDEKSGGPFQEGMEAGGGKNRFMAAARLIRGISSGRQPEDICESGVYSYGIISDALDNPELARSISEAAMVPYELVRPAAGRIIELLLWNGQDNPFTSLGLSPFATPEQIHSRWKRLISIYHPDRRMDDPASEETAKKINEAYGRAIRMKSSGKAGTGPAGRSGPVAGAAFPGDHARGPDRNRGPRQSAGPSRSAGPLRPGGGNRRHSSIPLIFLLASVLLAFFFLILFLGGEGSPGYTASGGRPALSGRPCTGPLRMPL